MHRNPLTKALCAAIWPWTEGRISPWWLGSALESGRDEWSTEGDWIIKGYYA